MTDQDKLRAAVLDAVQEWSEQNTYACDEWQPLLEAIDALLGDVVATYPRAVRRRDVDLHNEGRWAHYLEHADTSYPDGPEIVDVTDSLLFSEFEDEFTQKLDPNATYQLTISLRKVTND